MQILKLLFWVMRLDLPYMAFWSSSLCSTPQLSAKMSHNISQFMVTIDWFAGLVRIKYSFGWKQVWVNFKLLSQSSHLDGWQDSPGSSLAVHCVHGCMGRGGALAYLAAMIFCHKQISSVTNNHATSYFLIFATSYFLICATSYF